MIPPAIVSLADTTPSTLPWFWVKICSNAVPALVASHSPVWSPTSLYSPPSIFGLSALT
jgi:hypothetical protein